MVCGLVALDLLLEVDLVLHVLDGVQEEKLHLPSLPDHNLGQVPELLQLFLFLCHDALQFLLRKTGKPTTV